MTTKELLKRYDDETYRHYERRVPDVKIYNNRNGTKTSENDVIFFPNNDHHVHKTETYVIDQVELTFGTKYKCLRNVGLSWLTLDDGYHLEVDAYFPDLNLIVEYNGEQHYRYEPYVSKTYDRYLKTLENDEIKVQLCEQHGCDLMIIPYTQVKCVPDIIDRYINSRMVLQ